MEFCEVHFSQSQCPTVETFLGGGGHATRPLSSLGICGKILSLESQGIPSILET